MEFLTQDVFRRYLYGLMDTRFRTKSALAAGMGTSRAQLQAAIRQGFLTTKHMNALAEATGSNVWTVMRELSTIAEGMVKGTIKKLSDAELTDLLEGRERKSKGRATLQGELDEAVFSADPDETPDDDQDDEPDEPAEPPPRRRQSGAQHLRRPR